MALYRLWLYPRGSRGTRSVPDVQGRQGEVRRGRRAGGRAPEIAEAYKRYAWEEAEHASKFAELIGEVVWDTKTNLMKRMNAESGACEDKMRLARMAKEENLDAVHDTVHEMAKDEARHGAGFQGLYNRYFKK